MLDAITNILARCGLPESVLPPTELFNEGWVLRLVLDWFDRNRAIEHVLRFEPGASWYSEALLPSRFLPEVRGDPRAESFTHADGVVGHFKVASGERGDAELLPSPAQFIVTEAKLGSALSAGTKNAPAYDQAARNVACIAHMLGSARVDPTSLKRLGFYVLAPEAQLNTGVFAELVTKASVEQKVRARIGAYDGKHDAWFNTTFLPTLEYIDLRILSWEGVLGALPDTPETRAIKAFYEKCLEFNPLRAKGAV